ncbi:hypothetical protein OAR20_01985 [Candidatus Pelagibacter sp.]|jgi:hypothetical protein|nr:hypothetical protein [Candidatus Pelagibacter sp.]
MKTKSTYSYLQLWFVLSLIGLFFLYNLQYISYGLPFFVNTDESAFIGSTLSSFSILTNYFEHNYNPLYAPLLNLIFIVKSIFIGEMLINGLDINQIRLKIYFNPELFTFYGRVANLLITCVSVFILFLIFKKLKINFKIYSILLITFVSSSVIYNISTVFGKNSSYLLIYLTQLYFVIKYLLKIDKFNFRSYFLMGFLASIAWGVNYWPSFISIYGIFLLHYNKFKSSKINYLLIFFIIFIIFGPIINTYFVGRLPTEFISPSYEINLSMDLFIKSFLNDILKSIIIIISNEKNIILLIFLTPFFFISKYTNFKKEYLIIVFLIFEPIILFSLSEKIIPQLRYFAGVNSIILILTALTLNELCKKKNRANYLVILLVFINLYFIYGNFKTVQKINDVITKNHSFYNFNEKIDVEKSKILYLINLKSQETLEQNMFYLELYQNDLIEKNVVTKNFIEVSKNKIKKIQNIKNFSIINPDLKKNIIYFNYTHLQISNLDKFFKFISKKFDYVALEESEVFYLDNPEFQKKLKNYIHKNFLFKQKQFDDDNVFLRSQTSVIHYFTKSLTRHDYAENIDKKYKIIYGLNYSLYELKK